MNLPQWDLTDLYSAPTSPDVQKHIQEATTRAQNFQKKYEGKLSNLNADDFATAITEYEQISEILGRLGSYAQLLYAANNEDSAIVQFYQTINETTNDISTYLLFFTLEINELDDQNIAEKLKNQTVQKYKPWLDGVRDYRPHQLSKEIEKTLHEKSVTGRDAWIRLFDETIPKLRFEVDGKKLTEAQAMDLLSDKNPQTRKKAAKEIGRVFGENIHIFSLITNTLAKDKQIEDKWRKFPHPVSSRNLANQIEDEVVDALVKAVKDEYKNLSHKYYKFKAEWLGMEKLNYWDRNAPLPDQDDTKIEWDKARDTVLEAYGRFSPDLAAVGKKFFDNPWIDADVRPGKAGGAFAHPTVPSAHPYLLVNYQGKVDDVMTLAHELGHGVHQVLAGPQGHFLSDTPLTLAETASVFGEMLTFQSMLAQQKSDQTRKIMLAGKIEDMLNTVVRQIAFYEFERAVHDARQKGELSSDEICAIWMQVQHESLGDAFTFDDEYKYYWAYIPHFIHTPFYVYAYAFGDCLVNSLYAVYQESEKGFAEKYLDLLRAGGTKRHKELLAPFNLDATDPTFWKKGLGVIASFIKQVERL